MLFQLDLTGGQPPQVFQHFWDQRDISTEIRSFAERLVVGVHERIDEMDRLIKGTSDNWRIERMAVVDRNVLRMALFELMQDSETPAAVVIDEAIEIAKKFGSEKSGTFINGILDAVRIKIERGEVGSTG